MQQYSYLYHGMESFLDFIESGSIKKTELSSSGLLIQLYAPPNHADIEPLTDQLVQRFPAAAIVGASAVGQISQGQIVTAEIVVVFSFFAQSSVFSFGISCQPGEETHSGQYVARLIGKVDAVAAVLLLCTPSGLNLSEMVASFRHELGHKPIFGAGAADYGTGEKSWVLHHNKRISTGLVAVAFSGPSLQLKCCMESGWQPFGKKMSITAADGLKVLEIDHQPAAKVFSHYIGDMQNSQFSQTNIDIEDHPCIFAIMVEENNRILPKTPVFKNNDDAVYFVSNIKQGQKFRFGIGDPNLMLSSAKKIKQQLTEFEPEGVFMYSCGMRRMLLQDGSKLETELFSDLINASGFYCCSEILNRSATENAVFNTTLLAVGLREGPVKQPSIATSNRDLQPHPAPELSSPPIDHYVNQHIQIVASLMKFIRTLTDELETVNNELLKQSITDRLTGLYNRTELDKVLLKEYERACRYNSFLSIILIDIDNFKNVNDTFGHMVGDNVLVELSDILRHQVRSCDIVGRWGGEEFLVILPHTNCETARAVAEKARTIIESHPINGAGHQTASFGVADIQPDDSIRNMLNRADMALYNAKNAGKNRVCTADEIPQRSQFSFIQLHWLNSYECGHPEIDKQHIALFEYANRLISAVISGQCEKEIHQMLRKIVQLTSVHFLHEEDILYAAGYPQAAEHRKIHQMLLQKVNDQMALYEQQRLPVSDLLKFVIHDIIFEHMLKADRRFYPYVQKSPAEHLS